MAILYILVPGMRGDPGTLKKLKNFIAKEAQLEGNQISVFEYRSSVFSNRPCEQVARDLSAYIEDALRSFDGDVDGVVIVAHSVGKLIVRRAYLDAFGNPDYSSTPNPNYTWHHSVRRIILAGGLGRGVDLKTMRSRLRYVLRPLSTLARWLNVSFARRQVLRGSTFISQLRIDWLRFNHQVPDPPLLVHMLGNRDELSVRDDVIDIDQFENVLAIDVPARHEDIIIPSKATEGAWMRALQDDTPERRYPRRPHDVIIFLYHGIRDDKDCFSHVEDGLWARPNLRNARLEIIRQGYPRFSIMDFLKLGKLRVEMEAFIDRYTQELARNPGAAFHFGGHSNGTRILGLALKELPRMHFEHVYLAASPLPQDYEWNDLIDNGLLDCVRSDRATNDWPVGVAAKHLAKYQFHMVGSGGQLGFFDNQVKEYKFAGGHGAMLQHDNVPSIVEFLALGSNHIEPRAASEDGTKVFRNWQKYGDIYFAIGAILLLAAIVAMSTLPFAVGWSYPYSFVGIVLSAALALLAYLFLDRY